MTLVSDLVTSTVIAVLTACVQLVVIELLAPGTQLHELTASSTNLNGAERAEFWYRSLVMWVPLGVYVFCGVFPIVRAYRRQQVTAQRPLR